VGQSRKNTLKNKRYVEVCNVRNNTKTGLSMFLAILEAISPLHR
jgi:hypothetical protein